MGFGFLDSGGGIFCDPPREPVHGETLIFDCVTAQVVHQPLAHFRRVFVRRELKVVKMSAPPGSIAGTSINRTSSPPMRVFAALSAIVFKANSLVLRAIPPKLFDGKVRFPFMRLVEV